MSTPRAQSRLIIFAWAIEDLQWLRAFREDSFSKGMIVSVVDESLKRRRRWR